MSARFRAGGFACAALVFSSLTSAFVGGCGGPCGRASYSREVAVARTTTGPFRTATVRVSYAAARAHGDGASSARVGHVLSFDGDGRHAFVTLEENVAATREACETPFALSFSPDGLRVAISERGGGWRYAGIEGPQPLYCSHRTPVVSSAPWSQGPTTKDLVLEALRSTVDATTARRHAGRFDWRYGSELEAAARFACTHRHDADLRAALSSALAHAPGWRAFGGGQHDALIPLLRCASDESRTDATLRAEVQRALAEIVRAGSGVVLEPYARGCRDPAMQPTTEALWCLAREALDATPAPPR